MELSERLWSFAINHLCMCFVLVDNSFPEFNVANYADLSSLYQRVRNGERSQDLYDSIMNWSL